MSHTASNFRAAAMRCATLAFAVASSQTVVRAATLPEPAPPLADARSWTYQLQGDLARTARANADVAVVDWDHVRSRALLERLECEPDRTPRTVLGHLSIGEAEDTRPCWQACCTGESKPAWLTDRSQGWDGNYAVRHWDTDWQRIVKDRLSEIIDAGLDGVYLDRADTWETMRAERARARAEMVSFVRELSKMARAAKPGFSVLVQNAEELLSNDSYLAAIDGTAKEDLIHGADHDAGAIRLTC
jgi:cysteinyl-tRNA synthetase